MSVLKNVPGLKEPHHLLKLLVYRIRTEKLFHVQPWPGSSVVWSVNPYARFTGLKTGQGTYGDQPMNAGRR